MIHGNNVVIEPVSLSPFEETNLLLRNFIRDVYIYLVNKPLPAAGISADNVRGREKNEHLAEKRNFEGKCEILRTISQPRTLSADIPASRKGVYLFYNPPMNFFRN